jgi:hypothetical protein
MNMSKIITVGVFAVFSLCAVPAHADFFAIEADAQATYLKMDNIDLPGMAGTASVMGLGAGVKARVQILFLNAVLDYQHLFDNADMMHVGLGFGYRVDMLPVVDVYCNGTAGVLMLKAASGAFNNDAVTADLDAEMGFQARGEAGIEIPFAADFLAFGVGVTAGIHYITGEVGYDFSANVHLGLRL